MDYEQAMSFLEDIKKYGSRPGLSTIRALMRELGDVQERVPTVHIAGTNGKGSVGAMLSSVLTKAGYRVGHFNTPDVFSYEEEFLLCGEPIGHERLAQVFTRVEEVCRRNFLRPTRFEAETAAAFLWFCEEDCDIALVEAGMGGEADATNLITKSLVSVLTSVGMDHIRFLGGSPAEIARAKAGIIKPGCPVVTVRQEPEVTGVIREKCGELHAPLHTADTSQVKNLSYAGGKVSFYLDHPAFAPVPRGRDRRQGDGREPREITLGLRGCFQPENAACALKVLELLQPRYPNILWPSVVSGLRNAQCPGRFEKIRSDPDVCLDGAHNRDAARMLRRTLDICYPGRRILYIMGVLADKDHDGIIRLMFCGGDRVYALTPPGSRALPGEELAKKLRKREIDAICCKNTREAVDLAMGEANAEDVVVAFGSFSWLGEARCAFLRH